MLYFLFFLSGIPALIYQTVWQRSLFAIYGTNIQSVTIVVANFLLGLGIGALIGGKLSQTKGTNLLRLFGSLELVVGIFGFFSLEILTTVGNKTLSLPLPEVTVVVFLLLLLPTILMGASLPILVAYLTRRLPDVAQTVGRLYAVNTFGAAFACFGVALAFMRYLGLMHTLMLAVGLNGIVGIIALFCSFANYFTVFKNIQASQHKELNSSQIPKRKLQSAAILLLSFLTGYIALSYELLWLHEYSFFTGGKAADFALFLGYYLAGIAFGSYIFAKLFSSKYSGTNDNYSLLFWILLLTTLVCYLVLPLFAINAIYNSSILSILTLVLGVTILFGITFPLLSTYFVPISLQTGSEMGLYYFANILGSTASVLLTGFWLMNIFTVKELANFLLLLGIFAAFISLMLMLINQQAIRKKLIILFGCLILFVTSTNTLFHDFYEKLLYKSYYQVHGALKYLIENNAGIIAVTPENAVFGGGIYDGFFNLDPMLNVNWIWRIYAAPLFIKHPKNVLMIGLSSGSWAQVIAHNPEVEHLTIIEINPGYLTLIARYKENLSLLSNPKVTIIIDDGRRWLQRHPNNKYDFIVMNATFHWRANVTFLLSQKFFQMLSKCLTPSGIFYFNTTGSFDAVKTALSVFPYAWTLQNFMLVSNQQIKLDKNNLAKVLRSYSIDQKPVFNLQNAIDNKVYQQILALPETSMHDRSALEKLSQHAKIITEDNMATEWLAI